MASRAFVAVAAMSLLSLGHAQGAGDDFFAYANKSWLQATRIPEGRPSWGARDEIAQSTRKQVLEVLDAANSAPAQSDARKVADFRAAWLDVHSIEAHGLAPIRPMLARIAQIGNRQELASYLGAELPADVDPLHAGVFSSSHVLGFAVQAATHGEGRNVPYLLQGGLALSRDEYDGVSAAAAKRRARYLAAVAHVLARIGDASQAQSRAAAVVAFETLLARSHADEGTSADEGNADMAWTRDDFAREAPGLDWMTFLSAAGLGKQERFVAWQPTALKAVGSLAASQPLEVWKDYLSVRLVARYADVLPRAIRADGLSPAGAQPGTREQRAIDATQSALGDLVDRLYVERFFPATYKARVKTILANVRAEFTARVEAATWMSPATRSVAAAKLRTMYFGVGYPERWADHSQLVIDARDPVGNLRRVQLDRRRRALARLDAPFDNSEWVIPARWPGASLQFNENSYNFAAALLQPPKFDPAQSDAANYGAIGAILGHEMSHFVDKLGADYDELGRRKRWWDAGDLERYEALTDGLAAQFSKYRVSADVAVDGRRGLVENVADLAGLAAAFDAYRRTLGPQLADVDFVREQDRQFFIGFARAWRVKYRDDALASKAASDHSPEPYRVWTVRNLDAWYEAFGVRADQRLYLPPRSRVSVW